MTRLILTSILAALILLSSSAVPQRDVAHTGGGGGGDTPPLGGPASSPGLLPGSALGSNGLVVVLLTATAERPERTLPRVAIIRRGSEILHVARLTPGDPAVFVASGGEGLRLDVLGTDALGVPLTAGSVVRVVVP